MFSWLIQRVNDSIKVTLIINYIIHWLWTNSSADDFLVVESQFLETSKETEIFWEKLGNSSGWRENSVCEHSTEGRETTFRLSFQEVQKIKDSRIQDSTVSA